MFEIKTSGKSERRALYISLILSLLILGAGLAWAYAVGMKANRVDHELGHLTDALEAVHKEQKQPGGNGK